MTKKKMKKSIIINTKKRSAAAITVSACLLVVMGMMAQSAMGAIPCQWDMICDNYVPGRPSNGTCPIPHRGRATMLVLPGILRIFGGYGGYVPKSDMWTYTISTGAWRENVRDWREESSNWTMTCMESDGVRLPRMSPAVSYDSSGLIFLGSGACRTSPEFKEGNSVSVNDYWFYGAGSDKWSRTSSSSTTPGVRDAPATVWNRKIIIFGGYEIATNTYLSRTWISDIFSDLDKATEKGENGVSGKKEGAVKVTVLANNGDGPAARAHHSAVLSGDMLYVFGGRNATHVFNDLWRFDIREGEWKEMVPEDPATAPSPRHSHAAVLVPSASPDKGDLLMIFGGADADGNLLSDTHFYSFGQRTWTELVPSDAGPSPRKDATLGCSKDGPCWLFGGETADSVFVNDFYMLY